MSYGDFLERKRKAAPQVGVDREAGDVHPLLHDWQREGVLWALHTGRCALFWDCGLGKTFAQIEWARLSADTSLIVAPLSVARQTVREAHKIDVDVRYVRDGADVSGPGVWITNYEMVDRFDPALFGAVVLDECFPAGTPVDTPDGPRPIEAIRPGDFVLGAGGSSCVRATTARRKTALVRVYTKDCEYTCSEHHPWLTPTGWVAAKDLRHDDELIRQDEAVRLLWQGLQHPGTKPADAILRDVLLSELEDEPTGNPGASPRARSRSEARAQQGGMACVRESQSAGRARTDPRIESHGRPRGASEDLSHAEVDGSRSDDTRRQRPRHDRAAVDAAGRARVWVASRVHGVARQAPTGLPDALQARPGTAGRDARRRVRRLLARIETGPRPQEGREAGRARVDRVEVLKPGDPRFDRLSGGADSVELYDLDVEGHPSFSVGGLLVHNSSILKNVDGKTRRALTTGFAAIPRRLACTATPAPNDVAELTNHAEFLGVMSRAEMLAAYFVNDEKNWRLKGHAAGAMFAWMSTWVHALRSPADMGHPADNYVLPELRITRDVVDAHITPMEGQMFATDLGGVGGRANVRRQTLDARVARAAELVNHGEQAIVWCALNDEAAQVAALIDGAVNVPGSWTPDAKAQALEDFQDGRTRVLVTKCQIAGFGMNFQNAHHMIFLGLGDSYESYYQSIRRCWRFGQTEPVDVRIVVSAIEQQIVNNVVRKEREATAWTDALMRAMHPVLETA